ncbi:hypothetical protein [Nocardia donostiensis]|uniref:hypothetical protein n=1 Tax=Nocardia donostiensis TaxID=1538463 RepID=UPI001FE2F4E3|nr:hypothetical protein [Nocardia donostiensis]
MSTGTTGYRRPNAIGLIRRDIRGGEHTDLHALAERHGYRLVFTLAVDVRPFITALAVTQHLAEHAATAVVVPCYEHAEAVQIPITERAALITPVRIYPRGYRWPVIEIDNRRRS